MSKDKTPKWHNGYEGPAPCHATERACQFGEVFSSEDEARSRWEESQAMQHGSLQGLSKSAPRKSPAKELIAKQMKFLSASENYDPDPNYFSNYPAGHADATQTLALAQKPTSLLYSPVDHVDEQFQARSTTAVFRVKLLNGQVGYFKPFRENAHVEREINSWGTSSIQAIANEVNTYRVAQVMGGEYARLVPTTVLREINGKLGSFQEEVNETIAMVQKFDESDSLSADFRRAALFDFVIGNVDRHPANYLIDEDEYGRQRIRLIDNAYGISLRSTSTNVSLFNDNSNYITGLDYTLPEDSRALTEEDYKILLRVSEAVTKWESEFTITPEQAESLQDRITELRIGEEIAPLKYFQA